MNKKRRSKRAASVTSTKGSNADAFVLMSDILDKLHIIGFDAAALKLPYLTPSYFACSTNVAEQFGYFQSLCAWLLSSIGHSFVEWDDLDDPNSISNNVLIECRKLQFRKEFASTKLRQGSGQEICEILDFLTTLALKKTGYQIEAPVFSRRDDDEDSGIVHGDDDNMSENLSDSDIERSIDDEEAITEHPHKSRKWSVPDMNETNEHGDDDDGIDEAEDEEKTTQSVMASRISSKAWALEQETVSHLLSDRFVSGIKEWSTHLKKAKRHGAALHELWPDSKAKLKKYASKLTQYLERIDQKEQHLHHEFADLAEEFQSKHAEQAALSKEYNEHIAEIATTTAKLQQTQEQIADIKEDMDSTNNQMTDMTPIRRLRETHKTLKRELIDLDLRIGVTRQQLVRAKMKHKNI